MEIRDKIKEIKYSRVKPEERYFIEVIDGIDFFINDGYPESVFWYKNGIVLFEQDFKNGWLRCNFNLIWSVFINIYGYNYNDTQLFIKRVIKNNTKLNGLTPELSVLHLSKVVETKINK